MASGSCAVNRSQNWRPVVKTSRLEATMCGMALKCAHRAVMLRERPRLSRCASITPRAPGWVGVGAIVLTTVVAVLAYRLGTRGDTRPEVDADEAVRLAEADLRKEKVDA